MLGCSIFVPSGALKSSSISQLILSSHFYTAWRYFITTRDSSTHASCQIKSSQIDEAALPHDSRMLYSRLDPSDTSMRFCICDRSSPLARPRDTSLVDAPTTALNGPPSNQTLPSLESNETSPFRSSLRCRTSPKKQHYFPLQQSARLFCTSYSPQSGPMPQISLSFVKSTSPLRSVLCISLHLF